MTSLVFHTGDLLDHSTRYNAVVILIPAPCALASFYFYFKKQALLILLCSQRLVTSAQPDSQVSSVCHD